MSQRRWFLLPITMTLLMLALSGCASPAKMTTEDRSGDYGTFPKDYEAQINATMGASLKDPYSAVYEYSTPVKAKAWKGLINGGGFVYGWCVPFTVNAKNSFGGYVGVQSYWAFIHENDVSIQQPGNGVITVLAE